MTQHGNCNTHCNCWTSGYRAAAAEHADYEHQHCTETDARCVCYRRGREDERKHRPPPSLINWKLLPEPTSAPIECEIIGAMIESPDFAIPLLITNEVNADDFHSPVYARWYEALCNEWRSATPSSCTIYDSERGRVGGDEERAQAVIDAVVACITAFPYPHQDDVMLNEGDVYADAVDEWLQPRIDELKRLRFQRHMIAALADLPRALFAAEDPRKAVDLLLASLAVAEKRVPPVVVPRRSLADAAISLGDK